MTRCERCRAAAMPVPVFHESLHALEELTLCTRCYLELRPAQAKALHLARATLARVTASGGVHTPAPRSRPTKVPSSSSSLALFGGAP